MTVNEFLDKFNSLSETDKEKFLCHIYGSSQFEPIKKYNILEKAFDFIEDKQSPQAAATASEEIDHIEAWLNLDATKMVESTLGRIGVLENSKLISPGEFYENQKMV